MGVMPPVPVAGLDAGVHQQSPALLHVRGLLVFEGQDDLLQDQDQEEAHSHDELRQRELELRGEQKKKLKLFSNQHISLPHDRRDDHTDHLCFNASRKTTQID